MRLPRVRPRLRLRTLLIAVAVAGTALGGWQMWKRREHCLERSALHGLRAESWRRVAEVMEGDALAIRRSAPGGPEGIRLRPDADPHLVRSWEEDAGRDRARAEECDRVASECRANLARDLRLAARYRHVARHPWLPLPRESE